MYMKFVGGEPWPQIQKDLRRPKRRPVAAAIGYLGTDAANILGLRRGDWLACDASEASIRQGSTSAQALLKLQRRGVSLYSVEGLHAKVIASPTFAWVGSTNASVMSHRVV